MADTTNVQLQGWLARLHAGDPTAKAELVARAQDRLRRLTHKVLGDFARVRRYHDTDDVLQNSLIRLLRRLDACPPGTPAELFALAAREIRRELLDLARQAYGPLGPGHNEVSPPAAGGADTGPPPAADPGQSTYDPGRLSVWGDFHAHAERLPEDERAVFDLMWYHGLTRAEAAAVLGVSEATAKRRWLAARVRLQSALGLDLGEF
jgi:RNA polymerase sigma-70 factor (ECF subfamily)